MINKVKEGKIAMLAHKVGNKEIDWNERIYIQPKLDGIRCFITKHGSFSRSGKRFMNNQHIESELESFFNDCPEAILDGELYSHKFRDDFSKIVSIVRQGKETKDQTLVQFHCYDYINAKSHAYSWRISRIHRILVEYNLEYFKQVETWLIDNMNHAWSIDEIHLEDGYEGSILRNNEPYEHKRSNNLQKLKKFSDTEATIIAVVEGKGKLVGAVGKFIMEDLEGIIFGCPTGKFTHQERRDMWSNRTHYIGKEATFEFFGRTNKSSYRHPLFKGLRNYE